MLIAVRVDSTHDESGNQCAEERAPQCLHREIVADLHTRFQSRFLLQDYTKLAIYAVIPLPS